MIRGVSSQQAFGSSRCLRRENFDKFAFYLAESLEGALLTTVLCGKSRSHKISRMLEIFLEFPAGSFLFAELTSFSLSRPYTFEIPRAHVRERRYPQRARAPALALMRSLFTLVRGRAVKKKKKKQARKVQRNKRPPSALLALFCPLLARVAAAPPMKNVAITRPRCYRGATAARFTQVERSRFITLLFAINLLVNSIVARRDNRDNALPLPLRCCSPRLSVYSTLMHFSSALDYRHFVYFNQLKSADSARFSSQQLLLHLDRELSII